MTAITLSPVFLLAPERRSAMGRFQKLVPARSCRLSVLPTGHLKDRFGQSPDREHGTQLGQFRWWLCCKKLSPIPRIRGTSSTYSNREDCSYSLLQTDFTKFLVTPNMLILPLIQRRNLIDHQSRFQSRNHRGGHERLPARKSWCPVKAKYH